MSEYFDSTQNRVSDGTRARGSHVNDVRDEVGVGFDKLPSEAHLKQGQTTYGIDSGIADAYVVTMSYPRSSYVEGMEVVFIPLFNSTGASTINVDGIGAKNVKQPDDTEITSGVIQAGSVIVLRYNGTYFTITGGGLLDSTAAAAASADAAAASETNASASATAAGNSATAAGNSATAALVSENNAATSETNAGNSETAAAASAASIANVVPDLASNDAGKGSGLIGRESGSGTVSAALDTIEADDWVTSARLADSLLINANAIQFNLAAGVSVAEGQVAWNIVSKTLDLGMPGGVVQQIGQEIPLYVKNTSGVTVNDGDVVYVAGSTGVNLIIGLADGSDLTKCYQIGVVTTSAGIVHNGFGIVARFGAVRGIDTTGAPVGEVWADNDLLYLSATTPGALTKVPPGTPHYTVAVGIVINTHAVQGVIGVDPKQAISADVALGVSNLVAPTQGAVKSYVDAATAFSGALVWSSVAQTVANAANTSLDFDTENYDTDDYHEGVTNPERFTVPAGVSYVNIKASVSWDNNSNTTGNRNAKLLKNGTQSFAGGIHSVDENPAGLSVSHDFSSGPVAVIPGDYFELEVNQSSGGNLDVRGGISGGFTWFSIEKVG